MPAFGKQARGSACAEAQRRLAWPLRKDVTRVLGDRGCFFVQEKESEGATVFRGSSRLWRAVSSLEVGLLAP